MTEATVGTAAAASNKVTEFVYKVYFNLYDILSKNL